MRLVTIACAVLLLTATAQQLASRGWAVFVERPAGVGASESPDGADEVVGAPDDAAPEQDAAASAPTTTTTPPAPTRPTPPPTRPRPDRNTRPRRPPRR